MQEQEAKNKTASYSIPSDVCGLSGKKSRHVADTEQKKGKEKNQILPRFHADDSITLSWQRNEPRGRHFKCIFLHILQARLSGMDDVRTRERQ